MPVLVSRLEKKKKRIEEKKEMEKEEIEKIENKIVKEEYKGKRKIKDEIKRITVATEAIKKAFEKLVEKVGYITISIKKTVNGLFNKKRKAKKKRRKSEKK